MADLWTKELRTELRRLHGAGWQVAEQSKRFKLTYRYPDGARVSTGLPWDWNQRNQSLILQLASDIAVDVATAVHAPPLVAAPSAIDK